MKMTEQTIDTFISRNPTGTDHVWPKKNMLDHFNADIPKVYPLKALFFFLHLNKQATLEKEFPKEESS